MSNPHEEKDWAQTYSAVDSQDILAETKPFNQSLPPADNENLAHQADRVEKLSEDEDLVTVQMNLNKGRNHSRGQKKTKYQKTTERQERSEKRGRSKSRHENEKGDEGRTEKGESSKSYIIFQETSRKCSVPLPLLAPSRRLSRSRSAVSRLKRKTKEVSKTNEGIRYFGKMMDETVQPTPGMFKKIMTSTKTKWTKCHQKTTSIWKSICRTAKIVCDGVISALGLFVTYFLKYLIMFFILVLLVSITHRTICEIPLVKYYHSPCMAVWTPTPLSTDPQQDYALSQLAEPMQRHTEFLNQLQGNEYFQELPMALFQSSQWMRYMQIVLQFTSLEIPSKEKTVKTIGKYVEKSEETGENLSELWAELSSTVNLILWEREDLVKDFEKIPSQPNDISVFSSVLDIPGLLWSFVAKSLLDRPVLTPYQARQVNGEQARVELLTASLPRIHSLLAKLADGITSAHENFKTLNKSVYEIQSLLVLDISKISSSRDLLSFAESHPYQRFQAILGLRETQRFDLRTREAQLELLSSTNATVAVTIRELVVMADVVRKLQNDLKCMMNTLGTYEMSLTNGRLSVDGLLRVVKMGIDALAQGRVDYLARDKKQRVQRRKELHEGILRSQAEVREAMDQFHQLIKKQGARINR